jgi:subtilisin-like proprotein convertase family protein
VHHEFGHHLVQAAGSGQGQYGEGMGDVMSVLINDSPMIGRGFYSSYGCTAALRNAVTELQYPCEGVHSCAGLLSGSIWDARMKMIDAAPDDYIDILANLAVNAMLLHSGSTIDPTVTIDYLTLDDDDGNLANGTPHYDQISAGFSNHNLAPPEAQRGMGITPAEGMMLSGPRNGPFDPDGVTFTVENLDSEAIWYKVLVTEPWLDVVGGTGILEPGETADVAVSLNSEADLLGSGRHEDLIQFFNMTNHFGDQALPAVLEIDRFSYQGNGLPMTLPTFRTTDNRVTVDESGCIGDVNVFVDISHQAIGGMRVEIIAPSGETVLLHAPGGSGADIYKTYDDEGETRPEGGIPLSEFDYDDAAGIWTLRVVNNSYTYAGSLNDWSLDLQLLGAECPPLVENQSVTVPSLVTTGVTLDATSPTGGNIDYIITALPFHGGLSDPNGGTIDSVPYTLRQRGNVVDYTPHNGYIGPDRFKFRADDGAESIDAKVDVTIGGRQTVQSFDLASDPGWVVEGGWAFGQPTGGGSHSSDPESGYTGSNVYGYNLAGDYADGIAAESLTSSAIDCSDFVGVELSFMRWLGVESSAFDGAYIQASSDGVDWTTIWSNPYANIDESGWTLQRYDISDVADREPAVYLRWVMGETDGTVTYPGWNIDDIEVSGVDAPPLIDLTVEPALLSWTSMPGAGGYDLLRGDISSLRASGGDFSQATVSCIGDDAGGTQLAHSENPPQDSGYWYLVRADGGGEVRTYDSFSFTQSGLRDEEIEGASGSCP